MYVRDGKETKPAIRTTDQTPRAGSLRHYGGSRSALCVLLQSRFDARFDNTDVYRMMHTTLFGTMLPPAYGRTAPTRP